MVAVKESNGNSPLEQPQTTTATMQQEEQHQNEITTRQETVDPLIDTTIDTASCCAETVVSELTDPRGETTGVCVSTPVFRTTVNRRSKAASRLMQNHGNESVPSPRGSSLFTKRRRNSPLLGSQRKQQPQQASPSVVSKLLRRSTTPQKQHAPPQLPQNTANFDMPLPMITPPRQPTRAPESPPPSSAAYCMEPTTTLDHSQDEDDEPHQQQDGHSQRAEASSRASPSSTSQSESSSSGWTCEYCTFCNPRAQFLTCEMCQMVRHGTTAERNATTAVQTTPRDVPPSQARVNHASQEDSHERRLIQERFQEMLQLQREMEQSLQFKSPSSSIVPCCSSA